MFKKLTAEPSFEKVSNDDVNNSNNTEVGCNRHQWN